MRGHWSGRRRFGGGTGADTARPPMSSAKPEASNTGAAIYRGHGPRQRCRRHRI